MAGFAETFPTIEIAMEMAPEELAPFVLKHLGTLKGINRINYTHGTGSQDLGTYAGEHLIPFCHRLMEAWMWLEREGLISPSPGAQGDWTFITRRGREVLEAEDFTSHRKASLLPSGDLDAILVRKARPLFIRGDYETAVFQAFKEVEIRVRAKTGLPTGLFGQHLMRAAFDVKGGPLTDTTADSSERQGLSDLFAGAIALFKNPLWVPDTLAGDFRIFWPVAPASSGLRVRPS